MNFSFIALVFVLFNFISWNQVSTQKDSLNCWTSDKKRGTCISIRQCSPLLSLLQKGRPLSSATINFLRRSHCGFEGRNPLVCCPEAEVPPPGREPQPSSDVKDVTFHPRLSYLLPKSCGEVKEGDKITLGEASSLYEFPWMALLGYASGDGVTYRCAGTLINLRYILTAAHCLVKGWNRRLIRVRLGEYDLSTYTDCQEDLGCAPQVQDFGIEEVIPHPNYSDSVRKFDIGLIRLNREAVFNDAVRPICLPIGKTQQMNTLEGEKVTVTGWGATELGTGSSVLLKVSIPVVSQSKCAEIYNGSYPIDATQICAGGKDGKDSCSGDSGGPLHAVAQRSEGLVFVQHGVVSFGPKPCGSHQPGVYTKVGYYMDWILNTMKI